MFVCGLVVTEHKGKAQLCVWPSTKARHSYCVCACVSVWKQQCLVSVWVYTSTCCKLQMQQWNLSLFEGEKTHKDSKQWWPLVTVRERERQAVSISSVIKLAQGCYEHPGVCQNYDIYRVARTEPCEHARVFFYSWTIRQYACIDADGYSTKSALPMTNLQYNRQDAEMCASS